MLTSEEVGLSSRKTAVCDRLTPTLFEHYWPHIQEELNAEPELWNNIHSIETIYEEIVAGNAHVWAVADDAIRLVFFTGIYESPNGATTLHIWWMRGVGLKHFFPLIEIVLDRFAAANGCSRIEITGRKGFERLIRQTGGRYLHSVYGRPVRTQRGN